MGDLENQRSNNAATKTSRQYDDAVGIALAISLIELPMTV
jgi:hypothetical protein